MFICALYAGACIVSFVPEGGADVPRSRGRRKYEPSALSFPWLIPHWIRVQLGVTAGTIISKDIRVMMRPPGVPLSGCLLTPPNHFKLAVASW